MLDPRVLREDTDRVADALAERGYFFNAEAYLGLEENRKELQQDVESLQAERNRRSKEIGQAKANGEDIEPLKREVDGLGERLAEAKRELDNIREQADEFHRDLPNLPQADVPTGQDDTDNVEQYRCGQPPAFDFEPRDHVDIGAALDGLDSDAAATIAGARFSVLSGGVARLHRALGNFMLDIHMANGYREVNVPFIANSASLFGTGQLPKFEDDLFRLSEPSNYYLIPTAEVPVANLVADQVVPAEDLPLKYVAHTPCFRAEAGSAGRDVRGMIRQHQFEKVELVWVTTPEQSNEALACLRADAEDILARLGLAYRVMTLCTRDMGFSAARTEDLEVWLPSQETYREVSSCSNCEAFQARRMGARYRDPETGKPRLVHTLNGSALALGRTLVAILENYQQADGSIAVPEALIGYMGGTTHIEPVAADA
ncbi:serine--tRNA ligase [Salinisphaera sp. USBA-960]|uniref:serine--tRNA ligase n=1 Tax=Salinisphaera orenii TaxID=856731 RepID=UPI000DBE8A7E|nr:serine--tRNA ligase [Salifodinibacter halophilus]NNC25846.1 serine--tRNA ligase [Salifodinibacter halophilus]